ncbi:MAG: dTDP-4-dehydrorhamnose 3,5-epimerase [Planctomycetes bacterium]|nr:dTDP-4-dehydrorhamnose 3,5-epimerase [Planctomycetota bacterium]
MIFTPTKIDGVFLVGLEPVADERGSFARAWCADEFARHGLDATLAQCSFSYNREQGTVRGLHYQAPPHEETKLVRVTCGAVFDVVVDLRPASATYGEWIGVELSQSNHLALYIPGGCAHGLQTLADHTEVLYQISTPYRAGAARGVRWNDPTLAITWPLPVTCLSQRDRAWPDLALTPASSLDGG